jgi:hypothetical protein
MPCARRQMKQSKTLVSDRLKERERKASASIAVQEPKFPRRKIRRKCSRISSKESLGIRGKEVFLAATSLASAIRAPQDNAHSSSSHVNSTLARELTYQMGEFRRLCKSDPTLRWCGIRRHRRPIAMKQPLPPLLLPLLHQREPLVLLLLRFPFYFTTIRLI